jgi:acetyltransferase-like isoleucine patch superfamily enzyme
MLFNKIKYKLSYIINYFFYFLINNFKKSKKLKYFFIQIPTFNVRTIFRGQGSIFIGKECVFGSINGGAHKYGSVELQVRYPNAKIILGDQIWTNNNLLIIAANHIIIGSNTLIGQNVTIMDFEAHEIDPKKRRVIGKIGKIEIGKNVWIGNNVVILKNSVIGENSIIAAGAIVNGVFPQNVILGGVPAKVIKSIYD